MRYNPSDLNAWWTAMQNADRREWLRVSAEAGVYVSALTGRDDLIAVVEPGVGHGNLAVWIPEKAQLEVNTDLCAEGVAPSDVHMSTEVGRLRHPALAGGLAHEGAHALVSKWTLDQRPHRRAVVQAALLLEETRAEKRMVAENPGTRTFLRAGFHTLVAAAPEAPTTATDAARLAALSMARVDAGVLHADEMVDVLAQIVAVTGEDLYDALRAVWLDAQAMDVDDDQAAMEALGQRWLDLLPEDEQDEDGEGGDIIECGGMPSDGESKDGKGKGNGVLKAVAEAIKEAAEAEAAGEVEGAKVRDEAAAKTAEAGEVNKADEKAKQVFKAEISHGHGGGSEGVNGTIAPPASVRATANVLARAIAKAQHRERSRTVVASVVPPGRLRGAAAVQRSAQRSVGQTVTAEPWRQIVRKHVDQPPVTCGIAVDLSGSMRWAERITAEAAWAIAHAIGRNDGDAATVGYGNRVHAIVKPGESPKGMKTFSASGGTEDFMGALRALDGGLHLSSGTGARLLVIISDGQYVGNQREGGEVLLRRLTQSGVKVLWIDADGGGHSGTRPMRMPGVEVVKVGRTADLGKTIGAALTKALSAA